MQNKKFWVIFIVVALVIGGLIALYYTGYFSNLELPGSKTEKSFVQKDNQNVYYWTLTTNRSNLSGKLPDRFRVYTLGNDLVFDSSRTKPFFTDSSDNSQPQIITNLQKTSDQTVFTETYVYPFAQANFSFTLYANQKYADLKSSVKYLTAKNVEFEGFSLDLTHKNQISYDTKVSSYFDEAYNQQKLSNKTVMISQWSPHIITSRGVTLIGGSAEVMALSKYQAKFYSYYGPTRENVFRRDYVGADKAEPKIDLNFKHKSGDTVDLSLRAIITPDQLPAATFRWPYAKDAVLSITAHADLNSFVNAKWDGVNRLKAVYWGISDESSPNYGKEGVFAHNLRLTNTVFTVNNDDPKKWSYYANLEDSDFLKIVTEIYRRGIDIGAHRLTDDGIGYAKDVKTKIDLAFNLLDKFDPTVWIDHSNSADCFNNSNRELLAGCASVKGNPLYLVDRLDKGSWRYVWAGGQDSQNTLFKNDYQTNAFSNFINASQILYYYQGATGATFPTKLLTFASNFKHATQETTFTTQELDQLSSQKGFNNAHTYLVNYGPEVMKGSKPEANPEQTQPIKIDSTIWTINNHLEDEFKLLDQYQSQDKVWVRDFTTVADYLQSWKNVQILDFTRDSITIQNQADNAIDGLTLFVSNQKISTVESSGVYYPYIRDQYVVLPQLAKDEIRTINFKFGLIDPNLPQIINFSDKQIDISDASFYPVEKKLKISIAPTGKPGQDLTITNTEIKIQIPVGLTPSVTKDGQIYTNTSFTNQILTIKSDTDKHNFEIKL